MKKIFFLLLMIGFFGQNQYAQVLIDSKKVPANLIKKFDKKFKSAKEVKWFMVEPQRDYIVRFLNGDLEGEILYSPTAKEISSKMEVLLDKLNSKIVDYLKENHKDKKVEKAYLIVNGPRDKFYSIILYKSQGRKKEPLVYEIQFGTQGQYLTMYEPKVEPVAEKKYEADKYEETMDEETEDLEDVEYNQKIKKDDLPSPAVIYLKERFDLDYRFKEIKLKSNKKYGEYYYVTLKKQGEKKLYIHYFDMYGKLIKEKVEEL